MSVIADDTDEFGNLLLYLVQQGEVKALETQLLTTNNPEIYLNRVYDQPHGQKCTLLMIACLNNYEDIIRLFLNKPNLNLEVLNDIELEEKDDSLWMYEDVTVLWASAAINNFHIVKLLVENGAQINHRTKTSSTAFRCACWNGNIPLATYLYENGADFNISKIHRETNLVISVYNDDLNMASYIVDALGCDVNESMEDGRSPLYFAVQRESMQLVEFLLNRGARNFRSSYNQLSPILLAAEKNRSDLIDTISPHCSLVEQIEAFELLGSTLACHVHALCNFQRSFEYFHRALSLRSEHRIPKTLRSTLVDVLDNRQECQTIDELERTRLNHDQMYTEALLVRERILGCTHPKYRFSLRYRGAVLADNAQYCEGIRYWLYELQIRQQHAIQITGRDLRQWVSLFSDMLNKSILIPMDAWKIVVEEMMRQLKQNTKNFDYNLLTLLYLITIASQMLYKELIPKEERKLYYRLVRRIVQQSYAAKTDGSSLLHMSLMTETTNNDFAINAVCIYPCLRTSQLLLQCGADVNAFDVDRNTPVHVYVVQSNIIDDEIIRCLYNAGAHLDYVNGSGSLPFDITESQIIKRFLRTKVPPSLKCLCASLLQKKRIPFHQMLSNSLIQFVEKH